MSFFTTVGVFASVIFGSAFIVAVVFLLNDTHNNHEKFDNKELGWWAYIILTMVTAFLVVSGIQDLYNHPENYGFQKIPIQQQIEETINDTSSSN